MAESEIVTDPNFAIYGVQATGGVGTIGNVALRSDRLISVELLDRLTEPKRSLTTPSSESLTPSTHDRAAMARGTAETSNPTDGEINFTFGTPLRQRYPDILNTNMTGITASLSAVDCNMRNYAGSEVRRMLNDDERYSMVFQGENANGELADKEGAQVTEHQGGSG